MDDRTTTLRQAIIELARRYQLDDAFVDKTRALFEQKGMSLDADAAPLLPMLEETFARQASIAAAARRADRAAEALDDDLARTRQLGDEQRRQLGEIAASTLDTLARLEENGERLKRLRYRLAEFYTPLEP
jgi:hypothetical protein